MSKVIDSKNRFQKKTRKCPICKKNTLLSLKASFCSPRCRDIDLGNWMTESYYTSTPYLGESFQPVNDDT